MTRAVDPSQRASLRIDDEHPAVRRDDRRAHLDGGFGMHRQVCRDKAQSPVSAVPPDEPSDEVIDGCGQQLGRRRDLGEATSDAQDGHLIAELDRLVNVVRDEQNRLAQLGLQAAELVLKLIAHNRIDGREGLVHQHHRRVGRQRPRHPDALLLTAAEGSRIARRQRGVEAHRLKEFARPGIGASLVPPEQQRHRRDVAFDRMVREQPALLNDVADAAAQLSRVERPGVGAVDSDPPTCRGDHPVDHAQGGGLAAAGRADQDRDLPGGRGEREVVDGGGAIGIRLAHGFESNHQGLPRVGTHANPAHRQRCPQECGGTGRVVGGGRRGRGLSAARHTVRERARRR